jgi:hypothetical protein
VSDRPAPFPPTDRVYRRPDPSSHFFDGVIALVLATDAGIAGQARSPTPARPLNWRLTGHRLRAAQQRRHAQPIDMSSAAAKRSWTCWASLLSSRRCRAPHSGVLSVELCRLTRARLMSAFAPYRLYAAIPLSGPIQSFAGGRRRDSTLTWSINSPAPRSHHQGAASYCRRASHRRNYM